MNIKRVTSFLVLALASAVLISSCQSDRPDASTEIALQMEEDKKVVRAFLDTITDSDLPAFLALWHEDATMEMPFAPDGVPDGFSGIGELEVFWTSVFEQLSSVGFFDVQITATEKPGVVISEHRGETVMAESGAPYNNRYICVFEIVDGKIKSYREFYDPMIVVSSFGSADDLAEKFDQ